MLALAQPTLAVSVLLSPPPPSLLLLLPSLPPPSSSLLPSPFLQARTVLGGLGLTGEKALRPIGWLSGGEKARVALAIFAMVSTHVYVYGCIPPIVHTRFYVIIPKL